MQVSICEQNLLVNVPCFKAHSRKNIETDSFIRLLCEQVAFLLRQAKSVWIYELVALSQTPRDYPSHFLPPFGLL